MEYLNRQELDKLEAFLQYKRIAKAELARIVEKSPQSVNYWFRKEKFKRLIAKDFYQKLKKQAIDGFEQIEFLNSL